MRFSAWRIGEALFFLCVALLLVGQAMAKPLDHDEHQFVASGWLLAHEGLLPYRDYPYFHLPYMSLVYAVVYAFTTYPMLAARLIETAGALGSAILIYALLASTGNSWSGRAIGAAGVVIF